MFDDFRKLKLDEDVRSVLKDRKPLPPFGFVIALLGSVGGYLLIRIDIGLPGYVAPFFESSAVGSTLEFVTILSVIAWFVFVLIVMVRGEPLANSLLECRFGNKKRKPVHAVRAWLITIITFELFFGLMYSIEWLIGRLL